MKNILIVVAALVALLVGFAPASANSAEHCLRCRRHPVVHAVAAVATAPVALVEKHQERVAARVEARHEAAACPCNGQCATGSCAPNACAPNACTPVSLPPPPVTAPPCAPAKVCAPAACAPASCAPAACAPNCSSCSEEHPRHRLGWRLRARRGCCE